jgi:hypothetical protein
MCLHVVVSALTWRASVQWASYVPMLAANKKVKRKSKVNVLVQPHTSAVG